MQRRSFNQLLLAAFSAPLLFSACSNARPIRIGAHPWIGYETLFLAQNFGWLPKHVELVDTGVSLDTLAGLASGDLDAGALTLDEVLLARAQGTPLSIVTVMDVSAGADVLVSKPDITALTELRGKRIAVQRNAVGELFLLKILEAAQLSEQQLEIVDLRVDQQVDAWQAKRIDAAISYAPMTSRLEQLGAIRLFDSRQTPNTIFDVLAIRRDRLPALANSLRDVINAHFRALRHLRLNRQDAIHRIAARQGIAAADVARDLSGLSLPDLDANRSLLKPKSRLFQASELLNQLMTNKGLLAQPDSLRRLFDAEHLPDTTPALV